MPSTVRVRGDVSKRRLADRGTSNPPPAVALCSELSFTREQQYRWSAGIVLFIAPVLLSRQPAPRWSHSFEVSSSSRRLVSTCTVVYRSPATLRSPSSQNGTFHPLSPSHALDSIRGITRCGTIVIYLLILDEHTLCVYQPAPSAMKTKQGLGFKT